MGKIQSNLNKMKPEELKTLRYLGCNYISDYPNFLPLIEEAIYLALQGKLKITDCSYKKTAQGLPYITHLEYKRII